MPQDTDRIEPPPPEAYSRATNPERFRPLHGFALGLVARLRSGFGVSVRETFELLPRLMQPFDHALPPVTLTPATHDAAPIAIAFTSFPSLLVRCGRWYSTSFPECGCDACAATAEDERARLEELVGDVIGGQFREELAIPLLGAARLEWRLGSAVAGDGHERGGTSTIPRNVARTLRPGGPGRVQWQPWRPLLGGDREAASGARTV